MAATLGERLKAARESAGLTQQAVAEHFGLAISTVCRWEAESDPGVARIAELAELYGADPGALAFGPNFETAITQRLPRREAAR